MNGAPRADALRVLVFSTLFPNATAPHHGIFVAERLRHVVANHPVAAHVVAPVPYFPRVRGFGAWSQMAEVPAQETIAGFPVHHPRYVVTPKVGMSLYPLSMALACAPLVGRLVREEAIELIDAHYLYPDGVAAVLLGELLRLPVVLTARGTDVSLIPRHSLPRAWLRHAVARARGLIAVARALSPPLVALGAAAERVHVLRNGVDLAKFSVLDRAESRRQLALPEEGRLVLSVGHLIERKGHDLLLRALGALRARGTDVRGLIVGSGPLEAELRSLATSLGLDPFLTWTGNVPHAELAPYYSAADVLVLASSREGWANVLLESLACGTPVVATAVFGTPEVITSPELGILVQERTADAIAGALARALEQRFDRARLRAHAEAHSWEDTAHGVFELFRAALADSRGPA